MTNLWYVFRAEIRRYFAVQWSQLGDSLSWLLYTFLMFIAAVTLLNGLTGGEYGEEEQVLVMVGWLSFIVASDVIQELPTIVTDEAQTGTLEQLCLVPLPLAGVLGLRSLAFFLGSGARGLLAVVIFSLFVAPLPSMPALLLVFLISLVGAYGLGFLLAGVALVFKRAEALTGVIISLMIFLTGSLVSLNPSGWVFQVSKLALPMTWGIALMREIVTDQMPIVALLQKPELLGLSCSRWLSCWWDC